MPGPKPQKTCLWTNDVETTSIWFNTLRDETGAKVRDEGMPRLLELYAKYDIKSTFYITGYIAKLYPEVVKMVVENGHEVGSHGLSHEVFHGFDVMDLNMQRDHLAESKKILEDISGEEVVSFRAPALRTNRDTPVALHEAGYLYDSSIASQRFDAFLSFGSRQKLNWLLAPRHPYITAADNLFKRGNGPIMEIPLSAAVIPYLGTMMRVFPALNRTVRAFLAVESSRGRKPIVFDIHPNEMIDESSETRTIARRTSNPIKYLLADVIRGKLKVKNLGAAAVPLYEKELRYFDKRAFRTTTVKEYAREWQAQS